MIATSGIYHRTRLFNNQAVVWIFQLSLNITKTNYSKFGPNQRSALSISQPLRLA